MKKYITYSALLFLCMLFQRGVAQQQSSPLKIYDLNPGAELDSATSKEGKSRLFVNFKLSDPSLADSVFFKFGVLKGENNVIEETGKFVKSGADYEIKTQGPNYKIVNNEVICRIKITKKQFQDCRFISLIVKDKNGLYTNMLSMRIN